MAIFVAPPQELNDGICDYNNPENNKMVEYAVPNPDEWLEFAKNYSKITKSNIPSKEALKLIRFSNFLAEKLKEVIAVENCFFVRCYNAIDNKGRHITFIAPVDSHGKVIKTDKAIFLKPCCACPPSCGTDEN